MIPKVITVVTFGFCSACITLLLGGCYFREVTTFERSLLSGGCYFWEVTTFGRLLLLGGCYFRGGRYFGEVVTFGRSLLSWGSLLSLPKFVYITVAFRMIKLVVVYFVL